MTTETLLARTKDNSVIVFTMTYGDTEERLRLKTECEDLCKNINIEDFKSSMIKSPAVSFDKANTDFLIREISGYHYRKDKEHFCNNMKTDAPKQKDTLSFSYRMDDNDFPEMVKNLGFRIEPKDRTYEVRYNPETDEFNEINYEKTTAYVDSDNRTVSIMRNHFHFLSEDYERLQELIEGFHQAKKRNPRMSEIIYKVTLEDLRDRALFNFYTSRKRKVANRFTTIAHEIKHIDNAVFKDGISLKSDNKRLSVADYYRLSVENERSAYLKELEHNINAYLIKGNYNDFSMFYVNNKNFVADLKKLKTPAERIAYATNWPNLVAKKMKEFETEFRKIYDEIPKGTPSEEKTYDKDGDCELLQFLQQTKRSIMTAPLTAEEDTDGSEFRKIRSLFYNYKIYNPNTQTFEYVNLSKYITPDLEVSISDEIRKKVIEPQQARLDKRLQDFAAQKSDGTINPELVEPAKALMRGGLNDSVFIDEVGNFRVSSLYEEEDNTMPPPSGKSPEPTPSPTPSSSANSTPVPDDHADWSNHLQEYWNKIDGYHEIAKNNEEYKFKIKDATVRYTTQKDVEVSKNATYEVYAKLLKEPNMKNSPIEFLNTLSKEQALLLYVACVNSGHRMIGAVPTDLSEIENLKGIPAADMNKFKYRMQQEQTSKSNSSAKQSPKQHQYHMPISRSQNIR